MSKREKTNKYLTNFYENLNILDISYENIKKCTYAGGNGRKRIKFTNEYYYDKNNRYYKYFLLKYGENAIFPDDVKYCVCGHEITENCYITNGNIIIVLGNCCIRKYLPENQCGRTCKYANNLIKIEKIIFVMNVGK